jgi:hypothetical protein
MHFGNPLNLELSRVPKPPARIIASIVTVPQQSFPG